MADRVATGKTRATDRVAVSKVQHQSRAENDVDEVEYLEEPASNAWPLAISFCFALVVGVFVYDRYWHSPANVKPGPVPVVPVRDLSELVFPIESKLATDPVKAALVYEVYRGLSDAVAGKSGDRLADSRILEEVQGAYLDDLDTKSGVQVGKEIDAAIAGHLGIARSKEGDGWEPKTFASGDKQKLVEIFDAISKAAGDAK